MSDLIQRQAVIDALGERPMVWTGSDYELGARNQYDADVLAIETVPAAQSFSCDHENDTISRQAAIERATKDHDFYKGATTPAGKARRDELLNVMCWLGELPSARPEIAERTVETAQNVSDSDLISRKAAIDAIRASTSKYTGFMEMEMYTDDDAVEAIEALPSVQPDRKRGTWIEDDDGWDGIIWRCSECDAVFALTDGTPEENEYNFCPHCGAYMREVDDERPD